MKDFTEEFNKLIKLIKIKNPLVLVRCGDGEITLMEGGEISRDTQAFIMDGWSSDVGLTKLGLKLKESLTHVNKNWIYGIPCQCCNSMCKSKILNIIHPPNEQITYANIFVNSNYKLFMKWIATITEDVFLIANINCSGNLSKFPFKITNYLPIENDCVKFYEKNGESLLQSLKTEMKNVKNRLVFIAAGPLTNVLIHELWSISPTNRYIDVGSALDEYIYCRKTRPYMIDGDDYNNKVCVF